MGRHVICWGSPDPQPQVPFQDNDHPQNLTFESAGPDFSTSIWTKEPEKAMRDKKERERADWGPGVTSDHDDR
jgi:hypothetical protein